MSDQAQAQEAPPPAPPPDLLGEELTAHGLGDLAHAPILGEATVQVSRDAIVETVKRLYDGPGAYTQLVALTCADYPDRPERFEVNYMLLSITQNRRIRLKVAAGEETPVPSIAGIHPPADWFEREVWDLYGVFFSGHPDLRRILTDYGFEGHPLRKDFPLTGYVEMRYDENAGRCVYEPVKLPQDFRRFDFQSPWEAMTDMQLPGDEKAVRPPLWTLDKDGTR